MKRSINCVTQRQVRYSNAAMSLSLPAYPVFMVLGSPMEYGNLLLSLRVGMEKSRNEILHQACRYSVSAQ